MGKIDGFLLYERELPSNWMLKRDLRIIRNLFRSLLISS